jgi:hypothetical protein
MAIELQDVLSICRQIRGNDYDSGTHYLLGYLWANTPDEEKMKIAKLFADDLNKIVLSRLEVK